MQNTRTGQVNSNSQVKLIKKFINRQWLDICNRLLIEQVDLEQKINRFKFSSSYAFATPLSLHNYPSYTLLPQKSISNKDLIEYNSAVSHKSPSAEQIVQCWHFIQCKIKILVADLKHTLLDYFSVIAVPWMLKR